MKNSETEAQTLVRPEPTTVTYYDWDKVVVYIEKKYNCCLSEYRGIGAGTESKSGYWSAPQNFLLYVECQYDPDSGYTFPISNSYETAPGWVQEILDLIFAEFKADGGVITFQR